VQLASEHYTRMLGHTCATCYHHMSREWGHFFPQHQADFA